MKCKGEIKIRERTSSPQCENLMTGVIFVDGHLLLSAKGRLETVK
jgi:hypothetical protein